jgi:CDP-6-deoxy-D-xylo-4-hexulose-3-dehydrase
MSDLRSDILALVEKYAEEKYQDKTFEPGSMPVPPSGKVLGAPELSMMVDACLDGWLTTGRFNDAFEKELGAFLGVPHVLTTTSGSSANLLAFAALTSPLLGERQVKAGDEMITVACGFPTTVNPAVHYGITPVFLDVDIPTYNVDCAELEAAITDKTKVIMMAHTLGNPFNLEKVQAIAEKHNLWLIEDCCDALGTTYNGQLVGTFGDIGTLSFYPAHHITMGEGGAVFTKNPLLKRVIESIRDWGRDCYCAPGCDNTCGQRFNQQLGSLPHGYDHKYTYSHLGYNLKITDMQAACGLAQLKRLPQLIQQRKDNFQYLTNKLQGLTDFLVLPEATGNSDPSWFGYPITIKDEADIARVDLMNYLDQKKVGTRLLFAGNLTRQPYFDGVDYRVQGELKNTDRIMNNTFWVGIFPGLSREQLDYTAQCLEEFFGVNF